MVRPAVYLETSVVGYAVARPSRDLVVAARQQMTREWFAGAASSFDVFVSQLVLREAAAGDENAARARSKLLEGLPRLAMTEDATSLAKELVGRGAVPRKAAEDALHIAIAAVHGLDYLVTWNCKHIANATMRVAIDRVCRAAGYEPPVICTPEELTDGPRT